MSAVRAECSVCLTESGIIGALHCGHIFHSQCVLPWIQTEKCCPVCRVKTTEQQIIKRIYFATSEKPSNPLGTVNYDVKSEDLSFALGLERSKRTKLDEDFAKMKMDFDIVQNKLKTESDLVKTRDERIIHLKESLHWFATLKGVVNVNKDVVVKKAPNGAKIIVTGLPKDFTDEQLSEMFGKVGRVHTAVMNNNTGNVCYHDTRTAHVAVDILNGCTFGKNSVSVKLKHPNAC